MLGQRLIQTPSGLHVSDSTQQPGHPPPLSSTQSTASADVLGQGAFSLSCQNTMTVDEFILSIGVTRIYLANLLQVKDCSVQLVSFLLIIATVWQLKEQN